MNENLVFTFVPEFSQYSGATQAIYCLHKSQMWLILSRIKLETYLFNLINKNIKNTIKNATAINPQIIVRKTKASLSIGLEFARYKIKEITKRIVKKISRLETN
jgi:hypothetical protein